MPALITLFTQIVHIVNLCTEQQVL